MTAILPPESEEITATEAARRLRVTVPTVRRLPIPYRQLVKRGRIFYRISDIEEYVKSCNFNQVVL